MYTALRKYFRPLLGIICISLFGVFVYAHSAHAIVHGTIGDKIADATRALIDTILFGFLNVLIWLAGWLVKFGGGILDYVMGPAFNVRITSQTFVITGWGIVKDISNMFFIVVLIIMSFATIFRQEAYGVRRLLPTLIIIALLINFSLVVVGVVIDINQIFMHYFLEPFEDHPISTIIVNSADFDKLFTNAEGFTDQDPWKQLGVRFFLKVMNLFFLIYAAFVFMGLAALYVVRIVMLWIVAIFAPLAFVSLILPSTKGMVFGPWSKQLINWSIFGPIATFFLFLAGTIMMGLDASGLGAGAPGVGQDAGTVSAFFADGTPFIQAISLFILLSLSMKFAGSLTGGVGAKIAGKVDGAFGTVLGFGVGLAAGPALAGLRGSQRAAAAGGRRARLRTSLAARQRLERIPIAGRILGGPGAVQKERETLTEKAAQKYRGRSSTDLETIAKQPFLAPEDKTALVKIAAEKGRFNDSYKPLIATALSEGVDKKLLLGARPDLAHTIDPQGTDKARPGETPEQTSKRVAFEKIKDLGTVQRDAIADADIQNLVARATPNQVAQLARGLGSEGLPELQKVLHERASIIHQDNEALKTWLTQNQAQRLGLRLPTAPPGSAPQTLPQGARMEAPVETRRNAPGTFEMGEFDQQQESIDNVQQNINTALDRMERRAQIMNRPGFGPAHWTREQRTRQLRRDEARRRREGLPENFGNEQTDDEEDEENET